MRWMDAKAPPLARCVDSLCLELTHTHCITITTSPTAAEPSTPSLLLILYIYLYVEYTRAHHQPWTH